MLLGTALGTSHSIHLLLGGLAGQCHDPNPALHSLRVPLSSDIPQLRAPACVSNTFTPWCCTRRCCGERSPQIHPAEGLQAPGPERALSTRRAQAPSTHFSSRQVSSLFSLLLQNIAPARCHGTEETGKVKATHTQPRTPPAKPNCSSSTSPGHPARLQHEGSTCPCPQHRQSSCREQKTTSAMTTPPPRPHSLHFWPAQRCL